MTCRYDAFNIRNVLLLIRRNDRVYNQRNDSDHLYELAEAAESIDKHLESNEEIMEYADITQMRLKETNTYDMDEIALIRSMIELSISLSGNDIKDMLVYSLAKIANNSLDDDITYLGVINEDSELFKENPIIIY